MTTLQDMLGKRKGKPEPRRPFLHFGPDAVSETAPAPRAIRVVVLTYERPQLLVDLLNDIDAHRGGHSISVVVYDDASKADYSAVRGLLNDRGWQYVRARQNHGKRGFWRWVNQIYADQQKRRDRTFVMLPDDMRLCDRFFDRALNIWERIEDPQKVSLNLLRDNSREGKACWTEQLPIDCGPVFDIGWVDGAIVCNRRYFRTLDWRVDPIDPNRWAYNSQASSGVGHQLSVRLYGAHMGMYGVKRSLVAHVAGPSTMNALERRKNPLIAIGFIDGEKAHRQLAGASAPARRAIRKIPRGRFIPQAHGRGGVKKIK